MKKKAPPSTEAMATFVENVRRLLQLVNAMQRGSVHLSQEVEGFSSQLELVAGGKKRGFLRRVKVLKGKFKRLTDEARAFRGGIQLLMEWQVVMLVTFTETYLQDALASAAVVDPSLMLQPPAASYDDVLSASSLDSLTENLRRRWAARHFVDTGGPTKWIDRFLQMGARTLNRSLASDMEELWGLRHVVVHSAGVATAEFTRLYPGFGARVGDRVSVTGDSFKKYTIACGTFVHNVDQYLVNRFPALAIKSKVKLGRKKGRRAAFALARRSG